MIQWVASLWEHKACLNIIAQWEGFLDTLECIKLQIYCMTTCMNFLIVQFGTICREIAYVLQVSTYSFWRKLTPSPTDFLHQSDLT